MDRYDILTGVLWKKRPDRSMFGGKFSVVAAPSAGRI